MPDINGNEFIARKGFFITNRKDRGNKWYFNFEEGGNVSIPSGGFKNVQEAHKFIDFVRPGNVQN